MAKKKGHPSAKWPATGGKQPRGGSLAPPVPKLNFKWRCDKLDWDGPWAWHQINLKLAFDEIVPKLHDFESMTWGELDGKTGSHFVEFDKLCGEAQARLVELDEYVDALYSLRIDGRHRVWGVRDVATLRLVWWDPEHSVCPSVKKNT